MSFKSGEKGFLIVLIGLCYHGVHNSKVTPYNSSGKHIHIGDFENQMNLLRRKHRVVSLDELYEVVRLQQYIDKDFVFITFDDGYLNNLTLATVVLDKFRLPASLFTATNYIGTSMHIWTDELEDFFLLAELDQLLNFAEKFTPGLKFENDDRIIRFNETRRYLKTLTIEQRDAVLKFMPKQLISKEDGCQQFHTFLDWDNLHDMKSSGIWTIGSHTVTHNPLTKLDDDAVRFEVNTSFQILEEKSLISGKRYFAYPEGQPGDLSKRTSEILSECDVSLAFSAHVISKSATEVDELSLERTLVGFEKTEFPLCI